MVAEKTRAWSSSCAESENERCLDKILLSVWRAMRQAIALSQVQRFGSRLRRNQPRGRKVDNCGTGPLSAEFFSLRTESTVPITRQVSARTEPIRAVFGPVGLNTPNCSLYP